MTDPLTPPTAPQPAPTTPGRRRRIWLIIGAAGALLLLLCVVIGLLAAPDPKEPSPAGAPITTNPFASLESAAGIPPEPDPVTRAAYLAALDAIDIDIVHGKPDTAIDRGRNQCASVHANPSDRAALVDLTNRRFTSPDHPDGFGLDIAGRILDVVRQYLCPTLATTMPATEAPSTPPLVVHPGSFCAPAGATGVTSAGTPMVCRTTASDSSLRWRQPE